MTVSPLDPHHAAARHRARSGAALVLKGVLLNAVLAAAKLLGGVFGNTYALIADGVESLVDIVSSILVWAGFRWAAKPPDADHPYGHGKAESLAALAVALFLFAATAWIAVHAVREIVTPHRVPAPWTLLLLAGVVAIKFRFARRLHQASGTAGSTALAAEAWHHGADALTSAAAFIGISIGVIGGQRFAAADDWAALLACGVIAFNGVQILRQALGDIMDLAVPAEVEDEVRRISAEVTGVRGIDKCRVRRSGLSHLVDIHVEVDPELTVRDGHSIAGAVKHALLRAELHVTDVMVHIEPAEPRESAG